ncbi:hypothetical protein ACIQRN_15170 [[Kitasatospora] papulosa]|uniref:hypothetical protein n=1 Tax=[Kitasatospora] papulosa TaxID=1464011 RepID=UPI003821C352
MLQVFHDMTVDVVIGATTLVDVSHSRTNSTGPAWSLSRIEVKPGSEQAAKQQRDSS